MPSVKMLLQNDHQKLKACLSLPGGSAGKKSTCNAGDLGLILGLGRAPGEGIGYPLQYSGLENSTDRIVRGAAESWTRLRDFHFPSYLKLGPPLVLTNSYKHLPKSQPWRYRITPFSFLPLPRSTATIHSIRKRSVVTFQFVSWACLLSPSFLLPPWSRPPSPAGL